jgi:hypothetical protein
VPFVQPERQPTGSEMIAGADQPDGEWSITPKSGDPALVNRFDKTQTARCFVTWTAKGENRVGLGVASERRTLGRGERLTLDADYGLR